MENTLKNKILLVGALGLAGLAGCQNEGIEITKKLFEGQQRLTITMNGETILDYKSTPNACFGFAGDYEHLTSDINCNGTADFAYPLKAETTKALKSVFGKHIRTYIHQGEIK